MDILRGRFGDLELERFGNCLNADLIFVFSFPWCLTVRRVRGEGNLTRDDVASLVVFFVFSSCNSY